MDVPVGLVPTSRRTQTFGLIKGPKALKNQRWLLSFFLFCSFRQKMIWTGQAPEDTSPLELTTTWDVYLGGKLAQMKWSWDLYILEDMSGDVFGTYRVLGDTFLVTSHEVKDLKSPLVDLVSSITDNTNDDFLPAVRAPGFWPVTRTKKSDIF